jgi:AcrR family transcriptional regulator
MDSKERIQAKAREMFMRYGIRSVSMDDIAHQLSMSKKTIYQFYTEKNELVDAIMEAEIRQMQEECVRYSLHARDAVDEIFLTMELTLEQFRNLNPVVLHDMEKFHFDSYQRINRHKQDFLMKIISENLERGIREALYRPELNVDVLAKYRLESLMLPFNIDLFPPKNYNLAEVSRVIIEHYLYGLATSKGMKLIEKYKTELQQKIASHGM